MQFNLRGILLKWLPICPHIKHLRNASLGLLRLFWCAFKKAVCAEGAHSHLAETQWLHLSLRVNTHRGGPQIWPFQMPRPPRLSILCDNEQIPIQKHLPCDNVALCCLQHTWVSEGTCAAVQQITFRDFPVCRKWHIRLNGRRVPLLPNTLHQSKLNWLWK